MSLRNCLPGLVEDGKLSSEQAEEAGLLFDDLREQFVRGGDEGSADALASAAALDALERAQIRKKVLAAKTVRTRLRIESDLRQYGQGAGGLKRAKDAPGGDGDGGGNTGGGFGGGPVPRGAGPALFDHDPRAPYSNVEGRRKAVLGRAHRMMDGILASHNADLLGRVRNKAQLEDITREAFGEDSGNALAKQLAGAWHKTSEMLRQRRNRAGGDTGRLENWGLPQSHDWKTIRKAGYDAWRDEILPRLDVARMIDGRTGRPFSPEGLEVALREVFETIRSNGQNKLTPGAPAGRKSYANRHTDARFLIFKSADDWMDYAGKFGGGTPYDAMMGHIEMMSREIAAMEILGPNPTGTIDWLKGTMVQRAALDTSPDAKGVKAAETDGKQIDDLWAEYSLATVDPRNETLALVFSSIRSWQTATKLGSAFLSGISDFAFQMSRRGFNGLPQAGLIRDYLKLMKPGSVEDQKLAVRRGLIAEEWGNRTAAQSRYLMEELTGEIPRRMAEGVLRVSLLSRHTQSMRWVYGMEALSTYTEQAGKAMDALEPALRNTLERYGIDAAMWDDLRNAPMDTDRGVEWLSPHNAENELAASRFMEMILEETDIAVPVSDLKTRAVATKAERGTLLGEIVRSGLLFKGFGISVLLRQSREIMAMQNGAAARYAGGFVIGTTLTGALAMQLKAVASGQDPRPMEDEGFWGAALLQGGGFGIFGDFLNASQSRFGNGFASTLAGPLVDDVYGITQIPTSANPRGKLLQEVQSQLPGNNLWYTRLAFDRMVADQIQTAIDPDYAKSWRRMESYAAEQGTQYYWRPGDALPDRAPDYANALEEGPPE